MEDQLEQQVYVSNSPLEREITQSYLLYTKMVILGRAVPYLCDGLKPVQRRILYHMYNQGLYNFIKSGAITGEVAARYHPHGDISIYECAVRMTKDYMNNIPLIIGQGNFGSRDGDGPASSRYTEMKLSPIIKALFSDLEYDTVEYRPNYIGDRLEPTFIPSKLPLFLINGTTGIAVGVTSSIPPHNCAEVLNALIGILKNDQINLSDIIKGPDFPTGGIIINAQDLPSIYATGSGTIKLRGKYTVDKNIITIYEIPYNVNKAKLVLEIYELIESGIPIISVEDYSSMQGIRIEVKIQKEEDAVYVMNNILAQTLMESFVNVKMLLINRSRPILYNLSESLKDFINFRRNVVKRRLRHQSRILLKQLLGNRLEIIAYQNSAGTNTIAPVYITYWLRYKTYL